MYPEGLGAWSYSSPTDSFWTFLSPIKGGPALFSGLQVWCCCGEVILGACRGEDGEELFQPYQILPIVVLKSLKAP